MSFRRDGKTAHQAKQEWDEWKHANADLIPAYGLPPGVFRTRDDWESLLLYGYWCEEYYGKYVGNIDFHLDELTPAQEDALFQLLERTLTDEEKTHGCAEWHYGCPPDGA
jgi:hypothetical protein